jgi:hypothetical protein
MTAEHGHRDDTPAERRGGTGGVKALPSRHGDDVIGSMDRARLDGPHLEQPVDRWVRGDEHDP